MKHTIEKVIVKGNLPLRETFLLIFEEYIFEDNRKKSSLTTKQNNYSTEINGQITFKGYSKSDFLQLLFKNMLGFSSSSLKMSSSLLLYAPLYVHLPLLTKHF